MPGVGKRWPRGMSGNPSGRPRVVAEVRELARQQTAAAIETLVRIARDETRDPRARVRAAEALLDRGYGRPPRAGTIEPDGLPLAGIGSPG